ncbi:hypothetical protein SM191_10295 [Sphingomonas sp. 2378]
MQTPIQIVGLVATIIVCGLTLWMGSTKAKKASIAGAVAFVATPLVQNWKDWSDPQWNIFAVDTAFLVFLVFLAMTGSSWWLRVMIAAQLLTVMSHITMAVNREVLARAYAATTYLLWFVLLAALASSLIRPHRTAPRAS